MPKFVKKISGIPEESGFKDAKVKEFITNAYSFYTAYQSFIGAYKCMLNRMRVIGMSARSGGGSPPACLFDTEEKDRQEMVDAQSRLQAIFPNLISAAAELPYSCQETGIDYSEEIIPTVNILKGKCGNFLLRWLANCKHIGHNSYIKWLEAALDENKVLYRICHVRRKISFFRADSGYFKKIRKKLEQVRDNPPEIELVEFPKCGQ